MKKILLVQSRRTPVRVERERENFRRAIGSTAELDFVSALDEKLSWQSPRDLLAGFDGVIFGGSSDFDFHGGRPDDDPVRIISTMILGRTRNIVAHALEHKIPTLGVCFGHQIIGQMHRGMVTNDREQSKFGAYEVFLTDDGKRDRLFGALPEHFFAQYAHKDSVTNTPDGGTLLATGPACKFAVLRYGDVVYTCQFHPEIEKFEESDRESPEASQIVQLWIKKIVGA